MAEVTIRELRNHGSGVIDRAVRGEQLTVTRSGKAVAQLCPLRRQPLGATALVERWRKLPRVDPNALRKDAGDVVDAGL
jgi:prevent-host-death family protein